MQEWTFLPNLSWWLNCIVERHSSLSHCSEPVLSTWLSWLIHRRAVQKWHACIWRLKAHSLRYKVITDFSLDDLFELLAAASQILDQLFIFLLTLVKYLSELVKQWLLWVFQPRVKRLNFFFMFLLTGLPFEMEFLCNYMFKIKRLTSILLWRTSWFMSYWGIP